MRQWNNNVENWRVIYNIESIAIYEIFTLQNISKNT